MSISTSKEQQRKGIVRYLRKLHNAAGFSKGYNFALWLVLGGGLLGFACARFNFINFDGVFCRQDQNTAGAVPGECYFFFRSKLRKAGIIMHLGGILPAAVLVFFQFAPAIRHRALLFHRINGYIIILLSVVSTIGVFFMIRHSLGGALDMQAASGLSGVLFLTCLALAIYNVKKLQIEQHRAWMLRGWVLAGFIVTMRIIAAISSVIISSSANYYMPRSCGVIDSIYTGNQTLVESLYPDCKAFYTGQNSDQHVLVLADMRSDRIDQNAAALDVSFGMSAWIAIALHCIAVELYLRLTPAEAERLRRISYQRQLETGMKDVGNAGLTVQKVGYAEPWDHSACAQET